MKRRIYSLIIRIVFAGACLLLTVRCNQIVSNKQDSIIVENSTVLIPESTFTMGLPPSGYKGGGDNYVTEHTVKLSAFRINKYEITNSQFAKFLNDKHIGKQGKYAEGKYPADAVIMPSTEKYNWGLNYADSQWVPVAGYENHPVIFVSWYGATEFAKYMGGELPTEAQWECACRAGTTTNFNTGSCLSPSEANYDWALPLDICNNEITTSPSQTKPVGSYQPNAFGLYDMHGNVSEMCSDWYGVIPASVRNNPKKALINPINSSDGGYGHVKRGGDWYSSAIYCKSGSRGSVMANQFEPRTGFRLVFKP